MTDIAYVECTRTHRGSPNRRAIADYLKDAHQLHCGDLAPISAYKAVQSLGQHTISVRSDGENVEMDCRDTSGRLFFWKCCC
jgi:hypothetical protein